MNRRRLLLVLISVLFLLFGAAAWLMSDSSNGDGTDSDEESTEQAVETENRLRIIATGDMIAHDSVIANARDNSGYDFYSLMQNMQPYFDAADVRFCNEATPAGGEEFGISGFPIFNAPLEWHDGMEQLGCNVINLGTNHTYDKGEALVDAMVADWQGRDVLATAGAHRNQAEREQISYFEVRGVTFAFLSYSTYTNEPVPNNYSLVMYDSETALAEVAEANDNADFVIVSMRWGVEYADEASDTDRQIARDLAFAGADFVFGHGPHVLQPVEQINREEGGEAIVWYSLGNFLNTQIPANTLVNGIAAIDIDLDTMQSIKISFLPVYSHYEWSAEDAANQNLLARRNLKMFTLDDIDDSYFGRNQLDSTVQAERDRIANVLSRMSEVVILTPDEFLNR